MSAMASQITGVSIVSSTQPLGREQIKENIKAPRHWLLWGEFTGAVEQQPITYRLLVSNISFSLLGPRYAYIGVNEWGHHCTDNDLSLDRPQAIIETNAGFGHSGTNVSAIGL